jgi:hypothetical protein
VRKMILLASVVLVTAALGCATAAEPTEAVAPAPGGAGTSGDQFTSELLGALAGPRDYPGMTRFMGQSWEILTFRGNGEQLAPADAVAQMESWLLPAENIFTYEFGVDIAAKIGQDPMEFYQGNATEFVFTTGWGEDGGDEAIIVINEDASGQPFWQGILYAPGGF